MHRSNCEKKHLDIFVSVLLVLIFFSVIIPRFFLLESDAHRANNEGVAAELSSYIEKIRNAPKNESGMLILLNKSIGFNSEGWPDKIGAPHTQGRLKFGVEGDVACRDLFEALMPDHGFSAITSRDISDTTKETYYVAVGIDTGCKFVYEGEAPDKGKAYTLIYDKNTGRVTAQIEAIP